MSFSIRAISAADNIAIRDIIQTVMPEFGASGKGFALHDAEVLGMFEAYQQAGCAYFVVEFDGKVCGGGGVAPLQAQICELRKMYFLPELRGLGAGFALMQVCLDKAKLLGYQQIYLETLSGMDQAMRLYERTDFAQISAPMGNTGHFGCNKFYLRDL
jgi:putative acetyltransferase